MPSIQDPATVSSPKTLLPICDWESWKEARPTPEANAAADAAEATATAIAAAVVEARFIKSCFFRLAWRLQCLGHEEANHSGYGYYSQHSLLLPQPNTELLLLLPLLLLLLMLLLPVVDFGVGAGVGCGGWGCGNCCRRRICNYC